MKKVAHLTTTLYRYDQRMMWREASSLQEHGYDVTLVVNDDQGNETLDNGIKIVSTGFVPQNRWQRMTEGKKRVYELGLAQNADIYQLHETELLTVALELKRHGKKVIFDSHEIYGENIKGRAWIPRPFRVLLAWAYNCYETYVCRRIDGVIRVDTYGGRDWFAGRAKRGAFVGNFPRKQEFRDIFVPDYCSRKGICYSGSLTEERGITNLIKTANRIKQPIILAGKFPSKEYEEVVLSYSDYVRYLGFIGNRQELFDMYAHCAIGVSLLLDIGQYGKMTNLPTKVYEYMAMEMPVILSDSSYNRQLIEKYEFGLIANPSNVDDIALKIQWLLDHPKKAEEMGKNGKRLLEEKFNWEREAMPELLRLYNEIE